MLKTQNKKPHRRMYILVRKRVPPGIAAVNAAHAALVCYERWKNRDKETRCWFESGKFYKVLVAVTDAEFKKAKRIPGHVVIREGRYHNAEIAMAFRPRRDWPKDFLEFPFFPG